MQQQGCVSMPSIDKMLSMFSVTTMIPIREFGKGVKMQRQLWDWQKSKHQKQKSKEP